MSLFELPVLMFWVVGGVIAGGQIVRVLGVHDDDELLLKSINLILGCWKQEEKLQGMMRPWIPYARVN